VARREVQGGAAQLSLRTAITAASTSILADGTVTGWPTGASYPFVIVLGRGTDDEEKVLCSTLTGSDPATLAVTTRGYDGTTAVAHDVDTAIEHTFDATSIDDLFDHVYDTTRDDHTQYSLVTGTRAFTGVTALVGSPVSIGTANANGSALTFARSDHVHDIGNGAIDSAALFAAGVVDQAAIGANAVGTSELIDGNVTAAKFATGVLPVLVVADAAARTALNGTVVDGQLVYQDDTNVLYAYRSAGPWWSPVLPGVSANTTAGPVTWAPRTTDGDLTSIVFAASWPLTLVTEWVLHINPSDSVAWDAELQIRTASGGGGSVVGYTLFRNPGLNQRFTTRIVARVSMTPSATQTLYLHVKYYTDTPTTGFDDSSLASSIIYEERISA
jgi:hypothetical protein